MHHASPVVHHGQCFLPATRPYNSDWADGLQTLRYNLTKAYNSHHDYLEFSPGRRLDSANGGANRYDHL